MKKNNFIYLILLANFLSFEMFGQTPTHNIALTTTNEGAIVLKCFSADVYFENGMNVYRKATNENTWTKLNTTPIKKGDYKISQTEIDKNKTLKRLIDFANKTTHDKIKGIVKITMLLNAIQINEYAKFLGIVYEDKSVVKGTSYEYKVSKIIANNAEEDVSTSNSYVAGAVNSLLPPQNIEVSKHEKRAEFKWKIEAERYYAVNAYLGNKKDLSDQKLVTSLPIMINKVKNEKGVMEWPAFFFQKDSMKKNVAYYFQFTTIDYFNQEGNKSLALEVIPPDETPPHSPENFILDSKDFTFTLNWKIKKSVDLAGFDVYRTSSEKIPAQKVNKIRLKNTDTCYTDVVSKVGSYYYYVAAVDSAGNIGKTAPLSKQAYDNIPPTKVSNVLIKIEPGKVMLTWDKSDAGDLSGYLVLATNNVKQGKKHNIEPHFSLLTPFPIKPSEFIHVKPKNVKNEFLYKVIAVDTNFNRSIPSDIAKVTMPDVTPPSTPFIKDVQISADGFAVIEFLPNLSPDLKGYNIFRSEKHDSTSYKRVNILMIPPSFTSFVDRTIIPDTMYHYYLVAVDSSDNTSKASHPFPFEKPVLKDKLQTLNELKFNYNRKKNQIELSWNLKKDPNVLGFTIFRKTSLEDVFTPVSGMIKNNLFNDTKISEKIKSYSYEVREYSKHGSVIKSPIVSIETK